MLFAEFGIEHISYEDQLPRLGIENLRDERKRILDVGSGIGCLSILRANAVFVDPIYTKTKPEMADMISGVALDTAKSRAQDKSALLNLLGDTPGTYSDLEYLGGVMDYTQQMLHLLQRARSTFNNSFVPLNIQDYLSALDQKERFDLIISRSCLGNGLDRFLPIQPAVEVAQSLIGRLSKGGILAIGPIPGGIPDAKKTRDEILGATRKIEGTISTLSEPTSLAQIYIAEDLKLRTGLSITAPRSYSLTFTKS
jgi:SAM-dependent methyltransferase